VLRDLPANSVFLGRNIALDFLHPLFMVCLNFFQSEAQAAFFFATFALNSSCLAFASALDASRIACTFWLVSFSAASALFSAFAAWSASSRRSSESFFRDDAPRIVGVVVKHTVSIRPPHDGRR
jgi:hypothetical protein